MDFLRGVSDRIFGFDMFISYSRQDASAYAQKLNGELKRFGFRPFLDSQEMPPGEALTVSLRNALARSSALVLIVSPGALRSSYMPKEFDRYLEARKRRRIVPISNGRTLDDAEAEMPLIERLRHRLDVIWLSETAENLSVGPSAGALQELIHGFNFTRRNTIRHRIISTATAILLGLLVVSIVMG